MDALCAVRDFPSCQKNFAALKVIWKRDILLGTKNAIQD
jgi:hypothetical protein